MPLIVWVGAAMVSSAIPIGWLALVSGRTDQSRSTLRAERSYRTMRESVLDQSLGERLVTPVLRSVGSSLVQLTPVGWVDHNNAALARAGLAGRVSPEQVLGAKALLPGLVAAIIGLRLIAGPSVGDVVLMVAFAAAGFFLPDLAIRARADRRAKEIQTGLPDLLDQLTISVEAGLGFDAALSRTSRNRDDALGAEITRMLQDVRLGASRLDALDAMAQRVQVNDLKTVVLALRQAESLGVPLATPLRNVANEMREKRRFRAEERAQRLPTLMIFPLGICILPALFIIILGPAIISFGGLL